MALFAEINQKSSKSCQCYVSHSRRTNAINCIHGKGSKSQDYFEGNVTFVLGCHYRLIIRP